MNHYRPIPNCCHKGIKNGNFVLCKTHGWKYFREVEEKQLELSL